MTRPRRYIAYSLSPESVEWLRERTWPKAGPKTKRGSARIDGARSLYLGEQGLLYIDMKLQVNDLVLIHEAIPADAIPMLFICLKSAVRHGSASYALDAYGKRQFRCHVDGELAHLSVVEGNAEKRARVDLRALERAVTTAFDRIRAVLLEQLPELIENDFVGRWIAGGRDHL